MMSERDCEHGQLARSCNICELEQELTESRAMTAEESKAYRELKEKYYKPVGNWYQDVKAFHQKFGCYIGTKPGFPPAEITKLRTELVLEEFRELTDAMKTGDIVATADAFADTIYVLIGWALACGIPLDKVWEEVQRSNMLKEGGGTRADGKILKPAGWTPPDVEGAIYKCRICKDEGYTLEVRHGFIPDHHPSCTGTCEHCPVPVPTTDVEQTQCPCGQGVV